MAYIEFMPVSRIMKVKLIDAVDDLISLYIKELGEDLDFSNGGKWCASCSCYSLSGVV